MKSKKTFTTILTFILALVSLAELNSQNVKWGYQSFKYEYMPVYNLPSEYKNYRVVFENASTDGAPLDKRKLYYAEKYVPGFLNLTTVYSQSGFFNSATNLYVNPELNASNPDVNSDLELVFIFNNMELLDKAESFYVPANTTTGAVPSYYNYKLTFKFPYHIKLFDRRKNQVVFDTLIDTQKTTLFPADYRYDALGNKVAFPGHANKPELDMDYSKNTRDLYFKSKSSLMADCMNESKAVLKKCMIYHWDKFAMRITFVKTKNPVFDICDTASITLEKICDSVSFNAKKDKHLNWHTKTIRASAKKLENVWREMLSDEKYINELKNNSDKNEYIQGIKRNIVIALLLQDEFQKATDLLTEILPNLKSKSYAGDYYDDELKALASLIKREQTLYNKHKLIYNFE